MKLLNGLTPTKSLGPDELHPRVLKKLKQSINIGDVHKK